MVAVSAVFKIFCLLIAVIIAVFILKFLLLGGEAAYCAMQFRSNFQEMYKAIEVAQTGGPDKKGLEVSVPNCIWGAGAYYDGLSLRAVYRSKLKLVTNAAIGAGAGAAAGAITCGISIILTFFTAGAAAPTLTACAGMVAGGAIAGGVVMFTSTYIGGWYYNDILLKTIDANFIHFERGEGELPTAFGGGKTYLVDIIKNEETHKVDVTNLGEK
jgi:hypothetical protein